MGLAAILMLSFSVSGTVTSLLSAAPMWWLCICVCVGVLSLVCVVGQIRENR